MELHELHVTHFTAGTKRQGMSICCGDPRIGRFTIQGSRTTCAQDGLFGPDKGAAMMRIPDQRSTAFTIARQQVDRECLLPDVDILRIPHGRVHRPHDLFACGISQSMSHSRMTVTAFKRQSQFAIDAVEFGAQGNQFPNSLRSIVNHLFRIRTLTPRDAVTGLMALSA